MGENTTIEWTDHTFNPWIGCTKVSPACDHCYAEALAKRYGLAKWGAGEERERTAAANWKKPLTWDRIAAKQGIRRRVFCASLADVFDAEVSDHWRDELFAHVIMATPNLDWLLLTKRPQVAKKFFDATPAPRNVWLGTTVEDQKMADLRIPILLSIKVKVRFLSCEPLLGPIDLRHIAEDDDGYINALSSSTGPNLDWVIAGGESGPKARPSHPDWFRSLRDQCAAAGVPFFFKQWGEWVPAEHVHELKGRRFRELEEYVEPTNGMYRVGKKAAGALLDGREHREFPT